MMTPGFSANAAMGGRRPEHWSPKVDLKGLVPTALIDFKYRTVIRVRSSVVHKNVKRTETLDCRRHRFLTGVSITDMRGNDIYITFHLSLYRFKLIKLPRRQHDLGARGSHCFCNRLTNSS